MNRASSFGIILFILLPISALASSAGRLSFDLKFGLAFNNNVAGKSAEDYQLYNPVDCANVVDATVNYDLIKNDIDEVQVGSNFSQITYQSLHDYDQQYQSISLSWSHRFKSFSLTGSAYSYRIKYGGEEFLDMTSVGGSIGSLIDPIYLTSYAWFINNRFATFDDQSGQTLQVGMNAAYLFDHFKSSLSLDLSESIERTEASASRNTGLSYGIRFKTPLRRGTFEIEYTRAGKKFNDQPFVFFDSRFDNASSVHLTAKVPFYGNWTLISEYQHANFKTTLPGYDYNQDRIAESIQRTF